MMCFPLFWLKQGALAGGDAVEVTVSDALVMVAVVRGLKPNARMVFWRPGTSTQGIAAGNFWHCWWRTAVASSEINNNNQCKPLIWRPAYMARKIWNRSENHSAIIKLFGVGGTVNVN